ncbi:MAG: DUF255 domain-containing protein [Armatimonadota bacterium]
MSKRKTGIDWQEWSPEALDRAEKRNCPVLLAITATWCHWCHVMENTTFESEQVTQIINSRFVPVRADNDRRPDLNARYNMGGLPTIAFLMPNGDILTGSTYVPPGQMADMLNRVADAYREKGAELAKRAEEIRTRRAQAGREMESTVILNESIPRNIMKAIEGTFDPVYAGFGAQQKFPHVPALEFLLANFRRTGNREHLEMVTRTLNAMRESGVYDQVEGGFFRYSTTRDWSIPHYEKMLEDNSGLLGVFIQTFGLTGEKSYIKTARAIMGYLGKTLFDKQTGAFFGSQNADEDYYRLPAENRAIAGPPSVDRTIHINWNALTVDAYLKASETTGVLSYLGRALGTLGFLTNHCRMDGGFCHYFDGEPKAFGMLTDQVWTGTALLRAYECTGNRRFIETAKDTADYIQSRFADPNGGFFDVTEERQEAEQLPYREKLLDENALAARFLNRLAYYAHESAYRRSAESTLRSMASDYESFGMLAAPYGLAVMELLEEPVRIAVVGSREDPRTEELLTSTLKAKDPSTLVRVLDEDSSPEEFKDFGAEPSEEPRASICIGDTCHTTSSDPLEVEAAIREVEQRIY